MVLDGALGVARQAAAAAADVIRRHYAHGVTAETKADATPVTIADREAEIAIKNVLRAAFPDHAFHGEEFGLGSVATMVKHFPGGGPQKDGEDPHFAWGREQVYPGDAREYHLTPFIAAIGAGATQMMPYYGMPVGTDWEEVGFGFN